jgi:outer membrane biosynthesis protein TonB
VVDVTIDPSGKVADLAVLHTLGYGIESSVIGTLKTWTFRPATKDGLLSANERLTGLPGHGIAHTAGG